MRILAIETTETIGTLAAIDDERLLEAMELDPNLRSAQSLAPAIGELCRKVGWQPKQLELIGVTIGPGSFTGLRVGVTTAKMLAYAAGAQALGIGTLEVIAEQAIAIHPLATGQRLIAALDAQRQQVFAAEFRLTPSGAIERQGDVRIVDNDKFLQLLSDRDRVTGPGLRKLKLPPYFEAVEESLWAPTAAMVGQLAYRDYQAGRRDDLWQLVPHYYRKSAAEEKRGE